MFDNINVHDRETASDNYYRSYSYTTSSSHTLEECLEEYVSENVLDNDNKFICTKCSRKGQSLKVMIVFWIQNYHTAQR